MEGDSREIKIIGVDRDGIKFSPDKNECWVVPFKLSLNPDEPWQKKFYEVQQKDTSPLKRKARVVEAVLNVEVSGADDLQKILDILKIAVAETNVLCEEDHQRKIKVRQQLEVLQQKQRDATLKFKEDADNLLF